MVGKGKTHDGSHFTLGDERLNTMSFDQPTLDNTIGLFCNYREQTNTFLELLKDEPISINFNMEEEIESYLSILT